MSRQIVIGEILGAFGVRGWVKIRSYTEPPENLLKYSPWIIDQEDSHKECKVIAGQRHGNAVVASLEGVADRNHAASLQSCRILVSRDRLPALLPGQYYWTDLLGLEVRTTSGTPLGKVVGMIETGANDVMEVRGDRERLIPFIVGEFVKDVRLDDGFLIVDWDPDF